MKTYLSATEMKLLKSVLPHSMSCDIYQYDPMDTWWHYYDHSPVSRYDGWERSRDIPDMTGGSVLMVIYHNVVATKWHMQLMIDCKVWWIIIARYFHSYRCSFGNDCCSISILLSINMWYIFADSSHWTKINSWLTLLLVKMFCLYRCNAMILCVETPKGPIRDYPSSIYMIPEYGVKWNDGVLGLFCAHCLG